MGVNIDHVATLRQARGESHPSLVRAAEVVLEAGADQITIHLREDRRHIQDYDVSALKLVTQKFSKPLNLEMGCHPEIIDLATEIKPEWICLVPESRQERTTEGGLDLQSPEVFKKVKTTLEKLLKGTPKSKVSLFVEAQEKNMVLAAELGAHAVEIHTGEYAKRFSHEDDWQEILLSFEYCQKLALEKGLAYHAGHGLSFDSTLPLVKGGYFEEYNIGHWIICESLFEGLGPLVSKLAQMIKGQGRNLK